MANTQTLIAQAYSAFNHRDIDGFHYTLVGGFLFGMFAGFYY